MCGDRSITWVVRFYVIFGDRNWSVFFPIFQLIGTTKQTSKNVFSISPLSRCQSPIGSRTGFEKKNTRDFARRLSECWANDSADWLKSATFFLYLFCFVPNFCFAIGFQWQHVLDLLYNGGLYCSSRLADTIACVCINNELIKQRWETIGYVFFHLFIYFCIWLAFSRGQWLVAIYLSVLPSLWNGVFNFIPNQYLSLRENRSMHQI